MNYRKEIVLLLATLCFTLSGQQLRFKHITSDDGLSSIYISTIIQDDLDFMWFGTQDGLNKYDGYQIREYKNDPTDPNSLSSSEITCLRQIRRDLIFVGTRQGVNLFNPVNEKVTNLKRVKGIHAKINAAEPFDQNKILVGSETGLALLDLQRKQVRQIDFPLDTVINVKCILKADNRYYIGTEMHGLWILEGQRLKRWEVIRPDYISMKPADLITINDMKAYAGNIYVATHGAGIFRINPQHREIEERIVFKTGEENSNFVYGLAIEDNRIYAATGYGFIIYNLISKQETDFFHEEGKTSGLSSNKITAVYRDKEKNLWIGTQLGGVNVAFNQNLKFQSGYERIQTQYKDIYSFYEDDRTMWIGGLKTLVSVDVKTGSTRDYSKVIKDNYALCIHRQNQNYMWVGTWGYGLLRFDVNKAEVKQVLTKEFGGTVLCIRPYDENHILVGTIGDGLFMVDLNTLEYKNYHQKEGLPNANVNFIFRDSKNAFWLGMYDGGMAKLRTIGDSKLDIEKLYQNDGKPGQIASNIVLGINEDRRGNIWAATSSGLSKLLPDQSFRNFYPKDGLANSFLYSILRDSLDNFWMSSNNGVIKFNPLVPDKEILFRNYSVKDGLVNIEHNMGAAFISASGKMYFGGAKGLNIFRPTSIRDNLHPPQAYVVSYKRGGTDVLTDSSIAYTRHLTLDWRENYFQFEVVALDYTDPSKNKFKYKLEGYDNEWSAPTNVRYVSYTEVPGGEYVFKVKAANNDGTWNETPFEIGITVVPPFWKTKTFYVLIILLSVAGIYAFTNYRTAAIKKENKILEDKVAERTRELAEKNRDITSSIEYAKRIQEAILPPKEQIFTKLSKAFILYKPKDIVSGDFYWFGEKDGWKIFAVVDCTGHGVPGAFMSMIGHNLLNQIIQEKGVTDPGEILDQLHKGIQEALRQGNNEVKTNDGMDVSLVCIHASGNGSVARWAGANRPLVLIDSAGNFMKYDGNKFPVGGAQLDMTRKFTSHVIKPELAAMVYMFSDGYADQFGGEKGKKFMVKRFHEILGNVHLLDPETQKRELEKTFEQWRQNHEQVDDVLVVGISIG